MIKYQVLLAILAIILTSFISPGCSGITLWGGSSRSSVKNDEHDNNIINDEADADIVNPKDGHNLHDSRKHKVKPDLFSFDTQARDLKCGQQVSSIDARIVGGKMAYISDFPWIVSLQREKNYWFGFKYYYHTCGGSLISPSWIVTAAHCFNGNDDIKRLVAGTDNLDYLYRAQIRFPNKVIVHPKFESDTYNNDIALIKVDKPFNIQTKFSLVGTICLEPNLPVLPYDIATIAGFGASAFHESSRKHLYTTDIAIIDQTVCNISFSDAITDNMICAGGMISNKRDACSGDSGGPMQMDDGDHTSLVGIVSFGNSCATEGYPGIYTRVQSYYDWIIKHIDETIYRAG